MPEALRLLVLGAHPDDAEFHAGGLIARYRAEGHQVKIVSVTNGAAGHHQRTSAELIEIRRQEAAAVAALMKLEYEAWDFPDAALLPTLEVRHAIVREIRAHQPDLVLTHRLSDYHPDHRAVGQLVQDASYLLTVPLVVPDVPALRAAPVVAYMTDFFTRPAPLTPDIVLDITAEFDSVVEMLACHVSQVFEWLPYNLRISDQVPDHPRKRRQWLAEWYATRARTVADRFRERLQEVYGEQRGGEIEFAEAYEISEYAAPVDQATCQRLFPFMPAD